MGGETRAGARSGRRGAGWAAASVAILAGGLAGCGLPGPTAEARASGPASTGAPAAPFTPPPDPLDARRDEFSAPPSEQHDHSAHDDQPEAAVYTCPMHPAVRSDGPGSCPICGMALERSSGGGAANHGGHGGQP